MANQPLHRLKEKLTNLELRTKVSLSDVRRERGDMRTYCSWMAGRVRLEIVLEVALVGTSACDCQGGRRSANHEARTLVKGDDSYSFWTCRLLPCKFYSRC